MKLTQCDVCGKVAREGEMSTIHFEEGSNSPIIVQKKDGSYTNICDIKRDVCRSCAIKIMQMVLPRTTFLPEDEYEDEKKGR